LKTLRLSPIEVLNQYVSETSAPAGPGITENDWNTTVEHLVDILTEFNMGNREQEELATALTALEADTVEKN